MPIRPSICVPSPSRAPRRRDGDQSGLKPGETVVTDGHLRLVPGSRITVKRRRSPPTEGSVMNLSPIFIRRPVTTTLLMLGIIVFGVLAYRSCRSPICRASTFPTIQVSAALPGASPETMASSVALPLEKQFATIAGLTSINSTSTQGGTNITLQFDLSRDIDAAAQDVQAMIGRASRQLPPQMPAPPSYQKVNPATSRSSSSSCGRATLPLSTVDEYAQTTSASASRWSAAWRR